MKLKALALAALLVGLSGVALAEHGGCKFHDKSPEKRAEFFKKHQEKLHDQLKLTANQEPAWKALQAEIQPDAKDKKPDHEELAKLTTPERLDRMQAAHNAREATMEKRNAAIKNFYAQLTPEQKKVFDENAMPHGGKKMHQKDQS